MLNHRVGGRIDPRQRNVEHGDPDRPFADGDFAAVSRQAASIVATSRFVRISTREMVRRPDSASTPDPSPTARKRGFWADRDRRFDRVGPGVHKCEQFRSVLVIQTASFAERDRIRPGRDPNPRDHRVGRRLDPHERAFGVGHHPEAAGAGGDAALAVRDRDRPRRRDLPGGQAQPRHRLVAAAGHPEAAESHREPRARLGADADVLMMRFVRGSTRVTRCFGELEIQICSSMAIQSGAPGMSKTAIGSSLSAESSRREWKRHAAVDEPAVDPESAGRRQQRTLSPITSDANANVDVIALSSTERRCYLIH